MILLAISRTAPDTFQFSTAFAGKIFSTRWSKPRFFLRLSSIHSYQKLNHIYILHVTAIFSANGLKSQAFTLQSSSPQIGEIRDWNTML